MYGLVDDRGLTVVDPGLPGPKSWKALKARLKSAGYSVKDIHTVVVTHSHPDHFGGAGRIKKEAGARAHHAQGVHDLVARPQAAAARSPRPRPSGSSRPRSTRPTHYTGPSLEELPTLRDEDDDARSTSSPRSTSASRCRGVATTPWGGSKHPMPPLTRAAGDPRDAAPVRAAGPDAPRAARRADRSSPGATWLAIHTPGHTLDHLCLYDPEHGILLSGDHVLPVDHAAHRRLRPGRRAALVPRDARPRRVARRREARPPRARSPVRRRPRPRRGDQGAPLRAHGEAARRRRSRSARRAWSSSRTSCSPSGTGA